jgi:broad specificity phosphatase PhoE
VKGQAVPVHRYVLVRHAQAECNLLEAGAPVDASHADSPLTPLGQRQAAALAAHLPPELGAGPVFCSPMRRAADTAHALAQARGQVLTTDARLVEVAPPASDCLSTSASTSTSTSAAPSASVQTPRHALTQGDWDRFLERRAAHPDRVLIEGVESVTAQFARVRSFLRECRGGPGATLIVSHATTLELALLALLGLTPDALARFRFRLSNTGVHVVESEGLDRPARLAMVNGLGHLGRWL